MNRNTLIVIPLLLAISGIGNAADSPHNVSIVSLFGGIENTSVINELNDIDTFHYTLAYSYRLNNNLALSIGYVRGDSSSVISIVDFFTDSSLDYSAFLMGAKLQSFITKRNAFFARLNIALYDYDIVDSGQVVDSEDGTDFTNTIGWSYLFDTGLDISLSYEQFRMGSDITIEGLGFGVSYHF